MNKRGKKPYVNAVYVPLEVLVDTDNLEFSVGRIQSLLKMGYVELVFYTHSIGVSKVNVMDAVRALINDEAVLSHARAVSVPPQYEAKNKTILNYATFREIAIPPEVLRHRLEVVKATLASKQE